MFELLISTNFIYKLVVLCLWHQIYCAVYEFHEFLPFFLQCTGFYHFSIVYCKIFLADGLFVCLKSFAGFCINHLYDYCIKTQRKNFLWIKEMDETDKCKDEEVFFLIKIIKMQMRK